MLQSKIYIEPMGEVRTHFPHTLAHVLQIDYTIGASIFIGTHIECCYYVKKKMGGKNKQTRKAILTKMKIFWKS